MNSTSQTIHSSKTMSIRHLITNSNKKKNVETNLIYDDFIDNLDIYSDEVRLNQIMLNLVSNAVKFTNNGFIIISCLFIEETNDIIIAVKGTGVWFNNGWFFGVFSCCDKGLMLLIYCLLAEGFMSVIVEGSNCLR